MRHWKLENQVLSLVAFLIAVMLGILVFDAFERVQTNRINDAAQTQAMADVLAGRMGQLSTDSRDLLTVLADLPVLQRLDQLSCTAIADELDVRSSLYADAVLFNRAGDLVCSTVPVERAAGVSAARLDWFTTTVSGRGFHISEPFVDPISGIWVVMFSGPVYDPQGRFAGVLGLPINLRVLGASLAANIPRRGQTLTVLTASGRVMVREPDPDKWLGKDASGAGFFTGQRPDEDGVLEAEGLDGVRRYYSRQIGTVAGWQVLVGVPVEYVHTPAERQLRRGLAVILAATLIAVALATFATRRILRPLHLLVAGIGSNASEEQLRVAIGMGPPEIRSLAAELVSSIESKYKMRRRELVLAKVFESANEVIFVTDSDNTITAVNHAFETITGYSEAEAVGRDPRMLGSGRHDRDFYRELWTALETAGTWQGEMWNRRKSGEVFPAIQAISRVNGEPGEISYVAVMLDISRQKEIEKQLTHLAQHDPLTGLPNRGVLLSRLEMAVARNRRMKHQHLAVLSLVVDAFQDVNDTLGHLAGDDLLIQVARRLEACFDAGETVCRMGGAEFMVIIEGLPHSDALVQVIVRIHDAMRPAFPLAEREISVTVSLGISLHPDHADTVTELISFADAAAHRGKQRGRGGYAFYTGDMTVEAERRLSLEHDLRQALDRRGELFLVYQPQLSLRDGSTVGGEALIRWNHPVLGLLHPAEFIPLAEQTGHIEQITHWVVDEVCAQIGRWRDRSVQVPVVAINLSGQNLGSGAFAAFLLETLARHGLTPDLIDLEITEGTLIGDPESACREIEQLRGLGCRISIDDFGTGYSSLSYLKQFNAHVLKIDRSFVTGVDHDVSNQGIARAVIAVGHALQMEVMAEGVEQPAERQWLIDAGCDLVQGYLLCRPIPADEFIEFVQSGSSRRSLGG